MIRIRWFSVSQGRRHGYLMVFYDVIARSEIDMDSTQKGSSLEVKIFILNMKYKQLVVFSISLDSWNAVF